MITESFLTAVGFGGIVGFLIGIALRYIIKILAVIAGIFLSYYLNLSPGGTIVLLALFIFIITLVAKKK